MDQKTKRIAVIGTRGFPNVQGGIETHCEKLYPRNALSSYEINVYGRYPYIPEKPFSYQGVRIIPLKSIRSKSLETIVYTVKAILAASRLRPHIMHFHGIGPSFFVPFGKIMGCKVVATHHGFDYDREKWGGFAKLFLKRGELNLIRADAVITVSKHIQYSVLTRLGRRSVNIPNGVDLPRVRGAGEYCRKWLIVPGKYFLFVGRLVPEKCVHDLLEAFQKLQSDWKLVIAGSADHEGRYSIGLKERASKNPSVVMAGFIQGEELAELFSNAGCFVLPSSIEGMPIALLEALSYGLRCLVSDIPAHQSIKCSSLDYFALHDLNSLAGHLKAHAQRLPVSNDERDSVRKFIRIYYNWDKAADATAMLYESLI